MKRLRLAVFLVILLLVAFLLLVFDEVGESKGTKAITNEGVAMSHFIKEAKKEKEEVVQKEAYTLSQADEEIMLKIAKAEAGNQDETGQALVMKVILNRVESDKFPNSISEVVFAKNQFSPIQDGAYEKAMPDDITHDALHMVLNGWDETNGATYFRSGNSYDTWHYKNLAYLFDYGDHWFFK